MVVRDGQVGWRASGDTGGTRRGRQVPRGLGTVRDGESENREAGGCQEPVWGEGGCDCTEGELRGDGTGLYLDYGCDDTVFTWDEMSQSHAHASYRRQCPAFDVELNDLRYSHQGRLAKGTQVLSVLTS